MKKGNLTRNEAIAAAGLQAVIAVDLAEPRLTNRAVYNGACQAIEWIAAHEFTDSDGFDGVLYAYYYITGNPDGADWDVYAYDVI